MHAAAYRWIGETIANLPQKPARVLELGSRDINGTPRPLLPKSTYIGVDSQDGPGVDVIADGTTYQPGEPVDLVLCCEVLEHAEHARSLVANAIACTKPGGHVLITCATHGRQAHSAVDGESLRPGEHYQNIDADDLREWLLALGATVREMTIHHGRGDLYALALVPENHKPTRQVDDGLVPLDAYGVDSHSKTGKITSVKKVKR